MCHMTLASVSRVRVREEFATNRSCPMTCEATHLARGARRKLSSRELRWRTAFPVRSDSITHSEKLTECRIASVRGPNSASNATHRVVASSIRWHMNGISLNDCGAWSSFGPYIRDDCVHICLSALDIMDVPLALRQQARAHPYPSRSRYLHTNRSSPVSPTDMCHLGCRR